MSQGTVSLAANGKYNVVGVGRYFAILSATGAVKIRINGQSPQDATAGFKFGSEDKVIFLVEIADSTGSTNEVTFKLETQDFTVPVAITSAPTVTVGSVKNAGTYTKASAAATSATTTFSGSDAAKDRKTFCLFNNEPNNGAGQNITVLDNASTVGFTVLPQTGFVVETNGILKVTVPAAALPAQVLEIFYSA